MKNSYLPSPVLQLPQMGVQRYLTSPVLQLLELGVQQTDETELLTLTCTAVA